MSSTMDLYCNDWSGRCRGVYLTAKALGVTFNKIQLDLLAGEQNQPSFLALNPVHTVPTLVEGDFVLWESAAISSYLVGKYGKDDSLHPTDPRKRAEVDRLLYFDQGSLRKSWVNYWFPIQNQGEKPDPKKFQEIYNNLEILNHMLKGKVFAAGDNITIADHFLVATVSSLIAAELELQKFPNVIRWYDRCQQHIPGIDSEINAGAKVYGELVKSILKSVESKNS